MAGNWTPLPEKPPAPQRLSPLWVAVPSVGRPHHLAHFLVSVAAQTRQPDGVLILTDAPGKLTSHAEWVLSELRQRGCKTDVVEDRKQEGPGHAHERCRTLCQERGALLVLRGDDEMVLDPQNIACCESTMGLLPNTAAVGGIQMQIQDPGPVRDNALIGSDQWQMTIKRQLNADPCRLQWSRWEHPAMVEVEHLYNMMLYQTTAAEKAGGWPTCYSRLGYCEEADMSARLRSKGYRLVVDTRALAVHHRIGTGGTREASNAVLAEEDRALFRERYRRWTGE